MFTERAFFSYEFVASWQAPMTQYLSMLKTNIRPFMSIQRYGSLADLQDVTRRLGIEIETQIRD